MKRPSRNLSAVLTCATFLLPGAAMAQPQPGEPADLAAAARAAEQSLHQSFANLQFEDFGPAPVKGPLFQASAGGRILYYAPQSDHLLFATIYDKNGVNLTALAQDASAQKKLGALEPSQALTIGPPGAPTVIEFTDPDCPYCRALDRFWAAKAAEGKPVRRQIYFVSGIHPQAASKAEHILCSKDQAGAFRATYAGEAPKPLATCKEGAARVAANAQAVKAMGISGTPTLILDGRAISGFQQAEIEAWLDEKRAPKKPPS
ncbi:MULTISPECIES: DsbC family protein [unclassified Sphingobium]|uniref:DsbC family protein n=1 Tax=unclassified Sphingobium TaxID=2611147 RepID=UPI0005CBB2DC|nr:MULTISPECIES: DsbC family protein [unclassified Sphingobium]OAP32319.1 protein-disulfide isomerase [Sphingobium sp. 20006FA]AJR25273.1 protein-disulfide isomerase [Sphingobium sp. YBL2]KXU33110.1 protein-disulfide isomerase [Sphingobium sp. AM]KYC33890.1 protein-disulfide isomerase [Sphingobium sp. 22B]UXC91766.1 DsbC family protein [Sphingobium sp. RSMS]